MTIRKKMIDLFIGFFLFLPIYINPFSNSILASDRLGSGELAFPVSFFILPVVAVYSLMFRGKEKVENSGIYLLFVVLLSLWCFSLALYSSYSHSEAILHAIQWCLPFFWLLYFSRFVDGARFVSFIRGCFWGSLFGSTYIFLSGVLEILIYGSLQDLGRMTQNLILPGQYQLYVYMPTAVAFGALISTAASMSGFLPSIRGRYVVALNVAAFFSLIFMAAREGILVYAVGSLGLYAMKNSKRAAVLAVLGMATIMIMTYNMSSITEAAFGSHYRAIDKFAELTEKNHSLAGRNIMVEKYIQVIKANPLAGSAMVQPEAAPSAHNYYVDSFAWGGAPLFLLVFLFCSYALVVSLLNLSKCIGGRSEVSFFLGELSLCLVLFLCISNNINVPLRQPLTGPIGVFLIFSSVSHRSIGKALKSIER